MHLATRTGGVYIKLLQSEISCSWCWRQCLSLLYVAVYMCLAYIAHTVCFSHDYSTVQIMHISFYLAAMRVRAWWEQWGVLAALDPSTVVCAVVTKSRPAVA